MYCEPSEAFFTLIEICHNFYYIAQVYTSGVPFLLQKLFIDRDSVLVRKVGIVCSKKNSVQILFLLLKTENSFSLSHQFQLNCTHEGLWHE